jgi:Protein of unknown function (DUF5131)
MWPSLQYRPNVSILYSASDQRSLDAGAPALLSCSLVPILGLSLEPLTAEIPKLYRWLNNHILDERGRPTCSVCGTATNAAYAHIPVNCWKCGGTLRHGPRVSWVIVGGESGPGSRPCDVDWIRGIVGQCAAARVPVFVKQLGANVVARNDEVADWLEACPHLQQGPTERLQGALGQMVGFKDKKAGDPAEWPADLRVREFPDCYSRG